MFGWSASAVFGVGGFDSDVGRPLILARGRAERFVGLHREDLHISARTQTGYQPCRCDSDAGPYLEDFRAGRQVGGLHGEQPAHVVVARSGEALFDGSALGVGNRSRDAGREREQRITGAMDHLADHRVVGA